MGGLCKCNLFIKQDTLSFSNKVNFYALLCIDCLLFKRFIMQCLIHLLQEQKSFLREDDVIEILILS